MSGAGDAEACPVAAVDTGLVVGTTKGLLRDRVERRTELNGDRSLDDRLDRSGAGGGGGWGADSIAVKE